MLHSSPHRRAHDARTVSRSSRFRRARGGTLRAGLLGLLLTGSAFSGQALAAPPDTDAPRGIDYHLDWDADYFDNLHGGVRTGHATDSLVDAGIELDTGALGWWQGGSFALGGQAIASTGPSRYAGDLQTLSNIDVPNRRQISEFWYAQQIGESTLLRAGLMDVNSFFDVNDVAGLFLNSSFGITPAITANVPTPTYPDSAWGVVARFGHEDDAWRIGAFQGNPADRSSALHDGSMVLAERTWQANTQGLKAGIGTWYRQVPARAGRPAHDAGVYANLEQPFPAHPDIHWFMQLGVSPGSVNTVPAHLGGGLVFDHLGTIVRRAGIGFTRAWIRHHHAETALEMTARIPLFRDTVALQPDLQYIHHPSGVHPDAWVAGLRLQVAL